MKPVISHVLAIRMAFFAPNAVACDLPDTGQTHTAMTFESEFRF